MQDYKNERRKTVFIDKSFQSKFIIKFCLLIIIASLLVGSSIYYFNRQTTTVAFEHLKVVVKSTADFILPIILEILAIVTVLMGIATIGVTLFTSHKIAGPLYRLKIELEKMKNRDFSSAVQIRAKDQLKKVALEFNEMRVAIKDSISALKADWDPVKTSLSKLKDEIKNEEERKRIADSIDRIDSELARFKTG